MTKNRAAGILIENNKVLVIHRIKNSNEFWVFPGGGIEDGETAELALIREMAEETSLVVEVLDKAIEIESNFNEERKLETYFFIKRISGEPKLSIDSPEASRMLESNNENFYELTWLDIDSLNNYIIYPIKVKEFIQKLS